MSAIATAGLKFQPIERSNGNNRAYPVRNSLYMGPYRNALEDKVQLLMQARRKPIVAATQTDKLTTEATSDVKPRTAASQQQQKGGSIRKLSAKRSKEEPAPVETVAAAPAAVETEATQIVDSTAPVNSENYNELFLQLSERHTPVSPVKVNSEIKSSNKIRTLGAKKPSNSDSSASTSELSNLEI